MKKFRFSLLCIILFVNVMSISYAEMVCKVAPMDGISGYYKLDSDEFMGSYKKCLIEFFNKRIRKLKSGTVNSGMVEKVLVIPIEFKDVKFKTNKREYEDLLAGLKKYCEINSCYEKDKRGMTIEYTVVDKIVSEHDMRYYASNVLDALGNENVAFDQMAREAVEILKNKGFNFEEYDNDNDGVVDHIIIIHAGLGREENNDKDFIWSHSWEIQDNGVKVGDVTALNYVTVPENAKLGVIVHEFGHDLGLPDLYDISKSNQGVGLWDVMASGSWNYKKDQLPGDCPSNLSAWSREFLNWGDLEEVNESRELVFKNTNGMSNMYKVYLRDKYGRKNTNEYYLLEYRRKIGYDEGLPGEGILIWHIDENSIREKFFINYLNSDSCKMGIGLVQADGKFHLTSEDDYNYGDAGDPFPGDNPYNIFGSIPHKLNFDNSGNYSFIEGRDFKLDGETATMYIDLDIKEPSKKIETYAPLNESMVGNKVIFCCEHVPKCSEYKLQISDNEEFLFPMQYNICGDKYDIEVKKDKILFSENFECVLEEGGEYYWRIAPVNTLTNIENLEWSDPKKIIYAGSEDVGVPSNIRFDLVDDTVKISWVEEENAVGYIVLCNEKEVYTKTNTFEIKNNEAEYRIRVRCIGEYGASEFGNEVVINTLKQPSIEVFVAKPYNELILPEYLVLEITNGTFKKSGNYNATTVDIKNLPSGINQEEIFWLDENRIVVNLNASYSFILDEDTQFKVVVSRNLINDFYGDDLKSEFILYSNRKGHIDKIEFSFSGRDAKKIVGIKKHMEYSIDGGLTYKECIKDDMILDDYQVERLNESDGIIVRASNEKYYIVSILQNNRKPIVVADYDENVLKGLNSDMEYSLDGVNWIGYKEDIGKIENKIWVRYKGRGRVKAGDSILFEFPSILEEKVQKNIA